MFHKIASSDNWHICVLLYNFCAFAMQMPLGILADKCNRNHLFAAIGCFLVMAAYGLWQFSVVAAVIIGTGNGMFHIGGGIDILNISVEKSRMLGIFVSPGAFGIYFGTILGKGSDLTTVPILLAILVASALIIALPKTQGTEYVKNSAFSLKTSLSPRGLTAVMCLFLVVCLRSYVGLTLNFPWKSIGYLGVVFTAAVVFGKMAGGFIADRFGAMNTSIASLIIAAILFLFPYIPAAGILSILLFNMTMPVTLWAMAKIFPGAKGFSFGLLTFGLFLGFLPVYSGVSPFITTPLSFTIAAVISLALLFVGFKAADL